MNESRTGESWPENDMQRYAREEKELLAHFEEAYRNIVPLDHLVEENDPGIVAGIRDVIENRGFFQPTKEEREALEVNPLREAMADGALDSSAERYRDEAVRRIAMEIREIIKERKQS